jgi:hypothetical protein
VARSGAAAGTLEGGMSLGLAIMTIAVTVVTGCSRL